MFEALRKMILPIIVIVLVFFLGMIVLQWGLDITGGRSGAVANVAGSVNGEEISWNIYQQVYGNLYQNESQTSDYDVSETKVRELEKLAWDQLVDSRLLIQEARKQDIIISDDDLYLYLRFSPPQYLQRANVFQTDGQFDYQKYVSAMSDEQYSQIWASIEPQLREDLLKLKVQQHVAEVAHVTEEEIRQTYLDTEEKIDIGIVNIAKSKFISSIEPASEEEKQAWFTSHPDDYKVDERVILDIIRADKKPSQIDQDNAYALAMTIYDSAKTGTDFAELAKRWSKDPGSASNGGDLGWFGKGRMVANFDSASFAMKKGEIAKPIKTQFGWHILKHSGYRTTEGKKEANVSHILIENEASQETVQNAWDQINKVVVAAVESDFKTAAESRGVELTTTKPLQRFSSINFLNGAPNAMSWAYDHKAGDMSEVMETGDYFFAVRLVEKLPEGLAEYDDVKDKVGRDLLDDKTLKICRDTASVLFAEITGGSSPSKVADKYGFEYKKLQSINRIGRLPEFSYDPAPIAAAFGLKEQGAVSDPYDYQGGTVIMELLDRVEPDLALFNEKRDSVYNLLLTSKQQQIFRSWYEQLKENAEIVSNIDYNRQAQN